MPDILRLTGLATKLHNYPDQLSGGEQQRVSVARAFVNHPPLLLADEPTGNLDPETSVGIMQLLYRINRTGTTVARRHARRDDGRPHAPPRARAAPGPHRSATSTTAGYAAARHEHRRVRRAAARAGAQAAPPVESDDIDDDLPAVRPGFFIREAFRSISRNAIPRFAAMASVLVTVLVLGVFIPVVQATTGAANEVRGRVLVDVYLKRDATPAGHRRASRRCSTTRPTTSARSSSSPRRRPTRRRSKRNPEAYELLGTNPLPDTFRVTPDKPDNVDRSCATRSRPDVAGGGRTPDRRRDRRRSRTARTRPRRSSPPRAS